MIISRDTDGRILTDECYPTWGIDSPTITTGLSNRVRAEFDTPGEWRVAVRDGGSTIVFSMGQGAFELSNGEQIRVDADPGLSTDELTWYLLGPLMRLLLLQRSEFVLHASVVRIGDRTAAFIAPSGSGKSTMAAGLYDRGHSVLADDAGVVRLRSTPEILAGPSVLKLHPESADRLSREIEPTFPDGMESGKRFYELTSNRSPNRAELDRIYFLERGTDIHFQPVDPHEAIVELLNNSWGLPNQDGGRTAENFRQCSELVGSVDVVRLQYPRSFKAFDEVLGAVERECGYVG